MGQVGNLGSVDRLSATLVIVRDLERAGMRAGPLNHCIDGFVQVSLRHEWQFATDSSHATGATQLRGHDGQVKQREQEDLHARDRVGQTSGATQPRLTPRFRERIGNSRRTGQSRSSILLVLRGFSCLLMPPVTWCSGPNCSQIVH